MPAVQYSWPTGERIMAVRAKGSRYFLFKYDAKDDCSRATVVLALTHVTKCVKIHPGIGKGLPYVPTFIARTFPGHDRRALHRTREIP